MEFDSVIRGRRSIRAYRPEPVPAGRDPRDPRRGALGAVVAQHAGVERLGADRRGAAALQGRVQGRRRARRPGGARPAGDGRVAAGLLGAHRRAHEEPGGDARGRGRGHGPGGRPGAHGRPLRRALPARVRLRRLPRRGLRQLRHRRVRPERLPRRLRPRPRHLRRRHRDPLPGRSCAGCCPAPRTSASWSRSRSAMPEPDAPANTFARSRADLDEIVTWVS